MVSDDRAEYDTIILCMIVNALLGGKIKHLPVSCQNCQVIGKYLF